VIQICIPEVPTLLFADEMELTVSKLHSYIEVIHVIFFAVMWHPFEDLILTKAIGYVASESAEVIG
jgi:hypothetical protein